MKIIQLDWKLLKPTTSLYMTIKHVKEKILKYIRRQQNYINKYYKGL